MMRATACHENQEDFQCSGCLLEPRKPIDDRICDWIDICHKTFQIGRAKPSSASERRAVKILDVNTGTGIWAIDAAKSNPGSTVIGIDTDRLHPRKHVSNVVFRSVDKIEGPWTQREVPEEFDFVHSRLVYPIPRNLDRLYRSCFDALSKGGILELEQMNWDICSDDDTIPPHSSLVEWVNVLKGVEQTGYEGTKTILEGIGFVDVAFEKIKLPINPGRMTYAEDDIGLWFNSVLNKLLEVTRLRWSGSRNNILESQVEQEIQSLRIHAYFRL
ncbi:hypothetical protein LX36DRAFT_644705 [Colletotrichum falcatum]|nr:hypothetical protein LX36DRAFT_644705 [Colletotrichum falcatum]